MDAHDDLGVILNQLNLIKFVFSLSPEWIFRIPPVMLGLFKFWLALPYFKWNIYHHFKKACVIICLLFYTSWILANRESIFPKILPHAVRCSSILWLRRQAGLWLHLCLSKASGFAPLSPVSMAAAFLSRGLSISHLPFSSFLFSVSREQI